MMKCRFIPILLHGDTKRSEKDKKSFAIWIKRLKDNL